MYLVRLCLLNRSNICVTSPLHGSCSFLIKSYYSLAHHDDVIKWKHVPRYWPFVRGNHRSPVNSPHKGQWRGALVFSLICLRINGRVNNRKAGDLRRNHAHYDVTVMLRIVAGMATRRYAPFQWQADQYIRAISLTSLAPQRFDRNFRWIIFKLI